eukprot:GEMP01061882.1.p1 GENE.GEMP01061882.1~~GEMP01061882.1.p1  ORF type:complete len:122 (+),score=10.77 GEMP01061882.1:153-518(+)
MSSPSMAACPRVHLQGNHGQHSHSFLFCLFNVPPPAVETGEKMILIVFFFPPLRRGASHFSRYRVFTSITWAKETAWWMEKGRGSGRGVQLTHGGSQYTSTARARCVIIYTFLQCLLGVFL